MFSDKVIGNKWIYLERNTFHKELEENNRMGKTRNLFKKIGAIKGTFRARMGMIKYRSSKELTEAKAIEKRWQE